ARKKRKNVRKRRPPPPKTFDSGYPRVCQGGVQEIPAQFLSDVGLCGLLAGAKPNDFVGALQAFVESQGGSYDEFNAEQTSAAEKACRWFDGERLHPPALQNQMFFPSLVSVVDPNPPPEPPVTELQLQEIFVACCDGGVPQDTGGIACCKCVSDCEVTHTEVINGECRVFQPSQPFDYKW
ncbi:unnamed protein product, partial [Chrysoparadoxa australica]